ncbi:alpha/beta hydrolase [soil metagenome]
MADGSLAAPLAGEDQKARCLALRDGRLLAYDDVGDPDGRPVMWFHGFGGTRVLRHPDDEVARRLGVRLLAIDRPGIGRSSGLADRRLLDWPRDVGEFSDALGLGRFAVLGWSGGGPYALACAWAMPERVTVAGLINSPAPLAGVPRADYLHRVHRAAARAAGPAPWMIRLAMWRWARAQQRDPARHLDEAVAKMIEADRILVDEPTIRSLMLANTTELHRQGTRGVADEALVMAREWGFPLSEVRVPVRLWHGEADPTVPVSMGRFLAREMPTCQATFYPDEGHHLFFDRWEGILTALDR